MNKTLLLLIIFVFRIVIAQEQIKIVAEGTYTGGQNTTSEEVLKHALENARCQAIEDAFGINIKEETVRTIAETSLNSGIIDQFSRLSRTTTYARIVEEKILNKQIETEPNLSLKCTVKIEAEVIKENDLPDPNFIVELTLNKNVFYVNKNGKGEEIEFKVTSNQDCFLYLFNLMANDPVKLLMPSQLLPNNFYSVQSIKQDYEKKLENINFNVGILPGKNILSEGLYLIALKEKVDFTSNSFTIDGTDIIPTYKAAIYDIQKWLIKIPNNIRTENLKIYEIRKMD